jgi:phenylacetate-CoA ligase
MKDYMFNEKMETLDRGKIELIQLKRLKETVHRLYENVAYYRRKMKDASVKPDDIKTLQDVRKLPFMEKEDLRKNYPFGLLAVPLKDVVELHASSGTTGKPTTVVYTRNDIEVWSEVMARCLAMSGLSKQDIFQNPIPYGLFTGAFGFHYGALKIGALIVPSSGGESKRQITLMRDYGTTFMSGVISYGLHLAKVAMEMGIEPSKDLNVRAGLFGAETFTEGLRKKMNDLWDMDAHNVYGLSEMCGPGVSTDCDQHDGLHLWEDHFFVECIDPETGEPVEPEEKGELVISTLTKEAMPLLRYRTRDLAFLYDIRECECGRTHVKHSTIIGRTDDMIIVSGTNLFPSQIEEVLMKHQKGGVNYRIILEKKGYLDLMAVEVESLEVLSEKEKDELAKFYTKEIKAVTGYTPMVRILDPGTIPRDGIKAKRVIDLRDQGG